MRKSLPVWKKLVFALVAVGLCLALLEGGLALLGVQPVLVAEDPFVGFAASVPLFVKESPDAAGRQMVTAANKRGLFNLQRFADPKPAGAYRIFCLGGSTTYGHP